MRIVLASTERDWRGGEVQAGLLAEGLRRRGHEVAVLARKDGQLALRMDQAGLPVEAFPGRGRSPASWWSIRRFLRSFRPQVLHANDSPALACTSWASWGLPIPARIASRRVVFPIRSPEKYRVGCDRVLCVSHAVAEACIASGVPLDKLCVVHDGVDPQRISQGNRERGRRSLAIEEGRPLLVTVAALTDDKGHKTLIEAAHQVIQTHPDAVFAWAGEGNRRDELQTLAAEAGLSQHIRFLGFRYDIADLIYAADVFVMPSHMEGLCSSIIDAMFAARAIVATTAGGIPELVGAAPDEPPVAWLAPPKDATSLANALLECLAAPEERRQRGQRAHRRAMARFTAEKMVDGVLEVYRAVLERPQGRLAA